MHISSRILFFLFIGIRVEKYANMLKNNELFILTYLFNKKMQVKNINV